MTVFHLTQNQFWVADVICSQSQVADVSFASSATVFCALSALRLFLSSLLSIAFAIPSASTHSDVYLDDRLPDSWILKYRFIIFVCGFCLHSTLEVSSKVRRESGNTLSEDSSSVRSLPMRRSRFRGLGLFCRHPLTHSRIKRVRVALPPCTDQSTV